MVYILQKSRYIFYKKVTIYPTKRSLYILQKGRYTFCKKVTFSTAILPIQCPQQTHSHCCTFLLQSYGSCNLP